MKVSETLNKAADLIEERGWAQGSAGWAESESGLCLEGGIQAATGMLSHTGITECSAYRAVWNHLRTDSRWGFFRTNLFDWNDVGGRTANEVIEVLRACALIESAREEQDEAYATYEQNIMVGASS